MRNQTTLVRGELPETLFEKRGGVATVTINRPQAHNSYSAATLVELAEAVRRAGRDDSVVAVVVTGAGDRAFCTGGDVKEYERDYVRRPRDYWQYMTLFRDWIESLLRCPKPVVARLNGMAVGGGNETQLACDLTVMGSHAWLGQVGTRVGSVACGGATQWLPLAVGDKRARQMLLLNERIPAPQALDWGLVNEVAPTVRRGDEWLAEPTPEEVERAHRREDGYAIDLAPLDRAVEVLAGRLHDAFPECLRYTKAQTNFWKELVWGMTMPHAQEWLALHFACREPWEGMTAFAEKRPVDFAALRRRWAEDRSPETPWGAPVGRCAACGAQGLPAEFAHCGACGAPLAGPAAAREARP
ncbi:MAG TPA: enoyl-CoA hydratase-related protein [Thermoanaerobaculia bacterium]